MTCTLSASLRPYLRRALVLLLMLATMGLPLYALPEPAGASPEQPPQPSGRAQATTQAQAAEQAQATTQAQAAEQAQATTQAQAGDSAAGLSVEDILARHYEAIGGDRHRQVQTMKMTGSSIVMGMEAPYARWSKRPNKFLLEIYVQGMTGIQAFDGETAWGFMPFAGQPSPAALSPQETRAVLEGADFDGPLVSAPDKGHQVELLGVEPVAGRDAYKLQLSLATGGVQTHWVDVETFYVTRVTSAEGDAVFLDYRLFDGHPVPSVIELMGAMGEQIIYVDDVEFDVVIDDAAFRMK